MFRDLITSSTSCLVALYRQHFPSIYFYYLLLCMCLCNINVGRCIIYKRCRIKNHVILLSHQRINALFLSLYRNRIRGVAHENWILSIMYSMNPWFSQNAMKCAFIMRVLLLLHCICGPMCRYHWDYHT